MNKDTRLSFNFYLHNATDYLNRCIDLTKDDKDVTLRLLCAMQWLAQVKEESQQDEKTASRDAEVVGSNTAPTTNP
jgi:hypothetical protein